MASSSARPRRPSSGADLVIVAVKPHDVTAVLDDISPNLQAGTTVVYRAAVGSPRRPSPHLPPGTAVVRVMPNTPALVGMGMSVMSPAPGCPPESLALAERVLGAVGQVRTTPESQQDAVTAVSGSGPAYVFYVAEAMIDAGVMLGLPRDLAHDLTIQTLLGAATMLRDTGEHPTVLRENVTSPGGATAAAVHVLDDAAVKAAFANAMRMPGPVRRARAVLSGRRPPLGPHAEPGHISSGDTSSSGPQTTRTSSAPRTRSDVARSGIPRPRLTASTRIPFSLSSCASARRRPTSFRLTGSAA